MAVSLAPVALKGAPGVVVQLATSETNPGVVPNSLTEIEMRDYGVAFVATGVNEGGRKYLFLVPWSQVHAVTPSSNSAAFSFQELEFSEAGADITLTLVDSSVVSCTSVDVRPSGVAYNDGVDPGPMFRPWSQIVSLSQAVS